MFSTFPSVCVYVWMGMWMCLSNQNKRYIEHFIMIVIEVLFCFRVKEHFHWIYNYKLYKNFEKCIEKLLLYLHVINEFRKNYNFKHI